MSALQLAELDYIYKKDAASTVKTDNATSSILATSETIFTSPIISSGNVWTDSATLGLGPSAASSVVSLQTRVKMTSAHGVGPNPDIVALTGVAWTSGLTNWVDKKFHIGFAPKFEVASGTNPAPGDYKTIDNSSDYPMIFDYKSGVLTFLVTPYAANGVNLTAKTGTDTTWHVYITGYTYIGATLADSSNNDPIAIGPNAGITGQGTHSIAIGTNSGQINQGLNVGGTVTTKTQIIKWTNFGDNSFDLSTLGDVVPGTISGTFDIVGGGGNGSGLNSGGGGGAYGTLNFAGLTGTISGTVGKGGVFTDNYGRGGNTSLTVTVKETQYNYTVGGGVGGGAGTQQGGGGGIVPDITLPYGNGNFYTTGMQPIPGVYGGIQSAPLYKGNNGNGGTPGAGYLGYGGGGIGASNGALTSGQDGAILIKLTYEALVYGNDGNSVAIGYSAGYIDQSANSVAIGNFAGSINQGAAYIAKTTILRLTTAGTTGYNLSTLLGSDAINISINYVVVGGAGGDLVYYGVVHVGGGGGAWRTGTINVMSPIITATVGAVGSSRAGSTPEINISPTAGNGSPSSLTIDGKTFTAAGGDGARLWLVFPTNGMGGIFGPSPGLGGQGGVGGVNGEGGYPDGTGNGYAVNKYDVHGCGGTIKDASRLAQNGSVLMIISYMIPSGYGTGNSFAIGNSAGKYIQASRAIAIGDNAGITGQGTNAIAIGVNAGSAGASGYNIGQAPNSICIGTNAGIAADASIVPAQNSVAIGINSQIPGINSVAIGCGARGGANTIWGGYATAVGFAAGANENGTAIGREASASGIYSTAIGHNARTQLDGVAVYGESGGVAVGTGSQSYGNGLALGRASKAYDQQITLNANVGYLIPPTTTPGFYVNPIRQQASALDSTDILRYDPSTKEILHLQGPTFFKDTFEFQVGEKLIYTLPSEGFYMLSVASHRDASRSWSGVVYYKPGETCDINWPNSRDGHTYFYLSGSSFFMHQDYSDTEPFSARVLKVW